MEWLTRYAQEKNLPSTTVQEIIRSFLSSNLEIFYNAPVEVAFKNGKIEVWVLNENASVPHFVPVDFEEIPARLVRQLKKQFPDYLLSAEAKINYNFWRMYRHRAVEGTILRADKEKVYVDLGRNQIGTMLKAHFAPEKYAQGELKWFYVLKVYLQGCSVRVFLSRNSKNLPVALLKEKIPWGKFKCIRRIAGVKSVILSSVAVPKETIRELAEKMGEVVIVKKL